MAHDDPQAMLMFDPAARVTHHVPRGRQQLGYFVRRCRAEGASKAEVVRRCGAAGGLQSERAYTRRTLPAGVRSGMTAALRGDPAGALRAGMIVLGLFSTASGFAAAQREPAR
jgi:hypothetical protein